MNFRAFILVALACGSALLSGASLVHAQTPPVADAVISDLRYEPQYQITRPDGSFIPPSERVVTALVTWRSTETIGEFRILARRSTASAAELRGVVPASAGVSRAFEFKETWGFFDHPVCYIVQRGAAEAESCRPEPPSSGGNATPPPSGTPWPAPTGLRTTVRYEGEPPDSLIEISWPVLPGFTGVFEVQRAETRAQMYRPVEAEFITVDTVAASSAVSGRASFRDRVSFEVAFFRPACYRFRAVMGGETGPYSTEIACVVLPPGAGRHLTPVPPKAGTNESYQHRGTAGAALLVAGTLLVVSGLSAGYVLRRRLKG